MCSFRMITFDVLNTLLRTTVFPPELYQAMAKSFGLNTASLETITSRYMRSMSMRSKQYPLYGLGQCSSYEWWNWIVEDCFLQENPDMDSLNALGHHLFHEYTKASHWRFMPFAEQVLDTLKTDGIRMAIVSNFDERLPIILKNLGIAQYFSGVYIPSVLNTGKPDPDVFRQVLCKENLKSNEVLHVGDEYENDFVAPRKVGIQALLVKAVKEPKCPNCLDNLLQILPFVKGADERKT